MSYIIDHYSSLIFLHLSYYWILNHIIKLMIFIYWGCYLTIFFTSYRNRYYYWNTITDQVCWLSPVHPRANITVSAQRIQGTDCKLWLLIITGQVCWLMIEPSYCTVYFNSSFWLYLWLMVIFPWSATDLFGDQALTAREGSDEEMETNASDESDGVCIIIIVTSLKKTRPGF